MKCNQCGTNYEKISQHWQLSGECNYRNITERQHELISGLLMSDGWIQKRGNSRFCVAMTNKEFLEWLNDELGYLSTGVKVKKTLDDSRKKMYALYTISHPSLNEYASWYTTGDKRWSLPPEGLTPTRMKMLYVGDGSKYDKNKGRPYIRIGAQNQMSQKKETIKLFETINVKPRWSTHNLVFNADDSQKLWDYMGSPPPGFEYKW